MSDRAIGDWWDTPPKPGRPGRKRKLETRDGVIELSAVDHDPSVTEHNGHRIEFEGFLCYRLQLPYMGRDPQSNLPHDMRYDLWIHRRSGDVLVPATFGHNDVLTTQAFAAADNVSLLRSEGNLFAHASWMREWYRDQAFMADALDAAEDLVRLRHKMPLYGPEVKDRARVLHRCLQAVRRELINSIRQRVLEAQLEATRQYLRDHGHDV